MIMNLTRKKGVDIKLYFLNTKNFEPNMLDIKIKTW